MHPFLQRYGDAKRSTYILWFSDPESVDVAKGARDRFDLVVIKLMTG